MSEQTKYCIIPISNEHLFADDAEPAKIYDDAAQEAARHINETNPSPTREITAAELEVRTQDDFTSNCQQLIFHTKE